MSSSPDTLLQMSVHSLPDAQAAEKRTRRGRWQMLLVLLACAAPVVASYLTYYVIKPQGRTNYGELILPTQPVPANLGLTRMDGQAVSSSELRGQWLLITVQPAACDAACEQALYLQRQLREMLGRDKDRLDRVWLVPDGGAVRQALLPAMEGAWLLRASDAALQGWLKAPAGGALSSGFYLVDPHGEWMMRWPVDGEVKRIRKDISKLLKAAESWDQAGRP